MANLTHLVQSYLGRLAYRYFNWRQDTWNDLQLFATLNTVLLFMASLIKAKLVDPLDPEADNSIPSFQHFWQSVYAALVVVFGQDLPDTTASVLQQLWSLMVAGIGLAAFALVLALVEQVVLEVLKNNVQRGSQVYETGHVSDPHNSICSLPCIPPLLQLAHHSSAYPNANVCCIYETLLFLGHHLESGFVRMLQLSFSCCLKSQMKNHILSCSFLPQLSAVSETDSFCSPLQLSLLNLL